MLQVHQAITNFVIQRLGEKYVTPSVISFESVFEQSTPFSPIVFILSPGADLAGDLGKLAERMGYGGNRLKFLAIGQGQEKVYLFNYLRTSITCMHVYVPLLIALQFLDTASSRGHWLMLQNVTC